MKLLLDTHVWIWSILTPARLTPRVQRALQNPDNELWLSPISVWEALVLLRKGRIVVQEDCVEWLCRARETGPLKEAPLTTEVVLATREIALAHRDPADAFLAATAKVFGLTLVTADSRLIAAKGVSVLPNR